MENHNWVTNAPIDESRVLLIDGPTIEDYRKWRAQFIEGKPKASDTYNSEQLAEMGMVGLYRAGSLLQPVAAGRVEAISFRER